MKMHNLFSIGLLAFNLFFNITVHGETEPNNTFQQANTLSLNSSDSGALNEATQTQSADNEDWWQITLSVDGTLYTETNASSNLDIDIYIYDVNGNTIIATGSRYGSKEYASYLALKAATYFIRTYRSSGSGSYSILTKFTAAPYVNDSEPNDTYQTAQVLNLNSQSTGHIKYYSNGSTDYDDYWKVAIPYDGSLTVNTASDSADIDLYIYDVNGANIIRSSSAYGLTETIKFENLMPGTYFVRVYCTSGHGGYTINSVYEQTSINGITTNDNEKNDDYLTAINWTTFNTAGSSTGYGHMGYYTNSYTDYDDYWAVTTTTDGKLVINTQSSSTLDIGLYLYDINGTNIISSASSYGTNEKLTFENLAEGKYYVRTYKSGSGYGSYIITAEFSIPSMANDSEPNDDFDYANSISANVKTTGHLAYYSNSKTDYDDYYVITIPQQWDTLYVRLDSDKSLDADLYLYNSAKTIIATAGSYGTNEILRYTTAEAGTYYIRVYKGSGQGSYAVMVTNHYPGSALTEMKNEALNIIPTEFKLYQNYPNPFNPTTRIKYSVPKASSIKIVIYDILGKEIHTLVDEQKYAGYYEVEFNGNNLSSGIYFVRFTADTYSSTKKIILMK